MAEGCWSTSNHELNDTFVLHIILLKDQTVPSKAALKIISLPRRLSVKPVLNIDGKLYHLTPKTNTLMVYHSTPSRKLKKFSWTKWTSDSSYTQTRNWKFLMDNLDFRFEFNGFLALFLHSPGIYEKARDTQDFRFEFDSLPPTPCLRIGKPLIDKLNFRFARI